MLYNNISGTTLDSSSRLKFDLFENDNCYLAFSKSDLTWGNCALISISTPSDRKIKDMLNGFIDKKTNGYTEQTSRVRIYRSPSNYTDFDPILTHYEFIPELSDVNLYLEHINDNWCSIKGLPYNYSQFMKNTFVIGNTIYKWKYYIIPSELYEQTPISLDNIVKINDKIINMDSLYTENINLLHVDNIGIETKIHGLTRSTSLLGETFIYGLDEAVLSSAIPDLLSVVNDMMNVGHHFYITDRKNKKISDKLYLQSYETLDGTEVFNYAEDEKYLLFKSERQLSTGSEEYYTKISTNISSSELAIYNENLNFIYPTITSSNDVSDSNPPSFDITYLTSPTIDRSIFEVMGYNKIKKNSDPAVDSDFISKVSYVKMLKTNAEKIKYEGFGFNANNVNNKTFDVVTLTSSEPIMRYGNIKPKPNNTAYVSTDTRFWIWDLEFLIGDVVYIKPDISDANSVPVARTIIDVNYEEDYIIINQNVGVAVTPVPFPDVNFNKNASQIKLTTATDLMTEVRYAVCDNLNDAYLYNMDSVMIDLSIAGKSTLGVTNGIYEGMYRQISIVYNPKYLDVHDPDSANWTLNPCTLDFYSDTNAISLFNHLEHRYENGTLLYLANKTSIWRKYINGMETFKLVI